jgi:hypothetical protein
MLWVRAEIDGAPPPHWSNASVHGAIGYNEKGECIMLKTRRSMQFLACFALMSVFMGCAGTQQRESTGQYVDDSAITTKVKAAILDEASLKTLQINVKTFKGSVQLSGFVDSEQSLAVAGEVAGRVGGVKEVVNDLIVK